MPVLMRSHNNASERHFDQFQLAQFVQADLRLKLLLRMYLNVSKNNNHAIPLLSHRVKQNVQAMEVCRRPVKSMYDMNQNTGTLMPNFVPSSTGNLTVSFNNQINALHSQVLCLISMSKDKILYSYKLKELADC